MTYKTLEGMLQPDGKVTLPMGDLPDHPVRVLVTIVGKRRIRWRTQAIILND